MSEISVNLVGNDDEKAELANREARNDLIRSTFENLYDLEVQQAIAEDKHIQPIKTAQKKAWRSLKADTGMAIKNAKAIYKLLAMDRDAQDSEDEADTTQDDLREVFNALAVGGQVNFLNAFEIREK